MRSRFASLLSISQTFYERLLHQNPFAKKLHTQIVSTQKLCKKLWYEKAAHKILVKLTPGGQCRVVDDLLGLPVRDPVLTGLDGLPDVFLRPPQEGLQVNALVAKVSNVLAPRF